MPDPGAPLPPARGAITGLRSPSVRRRVLAGLLLLSLGSVLGVGVARWQGGAGGPAAATSALPPAVVVVAPEATAAAQPALPAPLRPAVAVVQRDVADLLQTGPGTDARTDDWRLARLRGNPQVLVLEFPGLADQGAAMNRVAAFIEKDGAPRDQVLDDAELAQLIRRQGDNPQTFFQGHDYSGDHLASFFSTARRQGQRLNAQEERLLQLLIDSRMLARSGQAYSALGLQAVVTFTGTQGDDPQTPQDETIDERRRESVLLHEISHGLFFTSTAYREHCWQFWRQRLTADERAAFRRMLGGLNYDPRNEELMVNEMQALLMHTPDTRAFGADSLGIGEAQLADLRARFRQGWAPR